jgi:hypothetical protein
MSKPTNEYIGSLPDLEVAAKIKEIQQIMQSSGTVTTGEIVDLLFDPLETSVVVKARIAIFTQIVMKNMREMK